MKNECFCAIRSLQRVNMYTLNGAYRQQGCMNENGRADMAAIDDESLFGDKQQTEGKADIRIGAHFDYIVDEPAYVWTVLPPARNGDNDCVIKE